MLISTGLYSFYTVYQHTHGRLKPLLLVNTEQHENTWSTMWLVAVCFFSFSASLLFSEKLTGKTQENTTTSAVSCFRCNFQSERWGDRRGGEGNQELGFKIGLRCHDRKGGEDSRRSGCLIENSGGGGGDLRSESWKQLTGNSAPRLQRHEQNYVSLQNSRSQDVCSLQHTGVKCAEHTVPEWNATHGCCCWCACVMTPMYLTPLTLSSDVYFRIKSLEWTFRGAGFGLRAISWLTLT